MSTADLAVAGVQHTMPGWPMTNTVAPVVGARWSSSILQLVEAQVQRKRPVTSVGVAEGSLTHPAETSGGVGVSIPMGTPSQKSKFQFLDAGCPQTHQVPAAPRRQAAVPLVLRLVVLVRKLVTPHQQMAMPLAGLLVALVEQSMPHQQVAMPLADPLVAQVKQPMPHQQVAMPSADPLVALVEQSMPPDASLLRLSRQAPVTPAQMVPLFVAGLLAVQVHRTPPVVLSPVAQDKTTLPRVLAAVARCITSPEPHHEVLDGH